MTRRHCLLITAHSPIHPLAINCFFKLCLHFHIICIIIWVQPTVLWMDAWRYVSLCLGFCLRNVKFHWIMLLPLNGLNCVKKKSIYGKIPRKASPVMLYWCPQWAESSPVKNSLLTEWRIQIFLLGKNEHKSMPLCCPLKSIEWLYFVTRAVHMPLRRISGAVGTSCIHRISTGYSIFTKYIC